MLVPFAAGDLTIALLPSMLIQTAFFFSLISFSHLPSGKIIDWIGYKRDHDLGLIDHGLERLLFYPRGELFRLFHCF